MIDAHFHIWQLARGDYDWLSDGDPRLLRDHSVEDWVAAGAGTGVRAGVLVQVTPTAAETAYIQAVARSYPDRILAVVGWADLAAADAPARVAELADDPGVVGLRPWLQSIPDPDWVLSPAVAPGLRAVEAAGLVYEALVRPVHLPRLIALARRQPELPILVDHAAKPDIAADAFQPWARDLRRLAEVETVTCKLSGLLTEAGDRTAPESLRPYVETVLDAFGPDRVLWGSDWPVVTSVADYRDWHELARSLVPAEAHRDVFAASVHRAYRLAGSAGSA